MAVMWVSTVRSVTTSRPAWPRFDGPSATSPRTSRSRSVRRATGSSRRRRPSSRATIVGRCALRAGRGYCRKHPRPPRGSVSRATGIDADRRRRRRPGEVEPAVNGRRRRRPVMGGAMKGRRRDAPGVMDEPPLAGLWSPRDLDGRPKDGPATFAMTRVDRPSRRGALPIVAMLGLAAGLAGVAVSGRPAPTTIGTSRSPAASGVALAPSATAEAVGEPSPSPASRYVVLTSPSYDGSIVEDRLTVVGFVKSAERDVAIALLDRGVRVRGWTVVAASKAGDPAWQARAWFETQTPTADLPIGRSLRLVVDLRAADGTTIETIERSVRIGPIIEPDSRGSAETLSRAVGSDPFTLGEDGVMGSLTLDGIQAAD